MKMRALLALAILPLTAAAALAADWPTKPVRVVVPFAAGGAADVISRLAADSLSNALGQQFIIDNRPGGGGIVASQFVARAEPDGYTFMQPGMSSHVIAPAMTKNPGFDPVRDFTYVAFIGGAPSVILVHPSLGVHSFKELVAAIKAKPDGIEYVSAGTGTVGNMITEFLATKEHIRVVHVPYKAGSGAIIDLLAGRVKVGALNWATAREHVATGSLIALAVSSADRLPGAPDLPTLRELGYPDIVTTTWHALAGPPGLPPEIGNKVNRAIVAMIAREDVRKRFEADGVESKPMTPAEVTAFVKAQVAQWAPVIKATIAPQ